MKLSSRAIVVSKESFGEADSYVQFLTKDWGMITVLARSAKKSKRRYVGGLDLFCHDEIFLRGEPGKKPYLQELTVLNSFQGIREALERVMAAGKVVQWVRKLSDVATPIPAVYSLVGQTLALIETEVSEDRLDLLCLIFKLKLLAQLGLKPHVEACARCSAPLENEVFFDLEAGGVLCRNCTLKSPLHQFLRLGAEERSFLTHADSLRLSAWNQISFPKEPTQHLQRVVNQFTSYHTHVRLPL